MAQVNDNNPLPEETAAPPSDSDLEREMADLRAEVEVQKERALRAYAEVENARKRFERERDEAAAYSIARFARDVLTVADNLSRALAALPAQARSDPSLKPVLEGVEATERELQAALARHGVKPVEALGQRFDPHLHQAIAEVPAEGAEPGTIVNVVQGGYRIGERLLRPAMVTVARPESPPKAAGETAEGASGQA